MHMGGQPLSLLLPPREKTGSGFIMCWTPLRHLHSHTVPSAERDAFRTRFVNKEEKWKLYTDT